MSHFAGPALFLFALVLTLARPAGAADAAPDRDRPFTVVVFGDSTTARRGSLDIYADRLARSLAQAGVPARVHNAGVGGCTTEQGRRRFERDVLAQEPDLVVVQFGINDSAVDVWKDPPAAGPRVGREQYRENLAFFVRELRARKSAVVLMTPNPVRWTQSLKNTYGKPPYLPGDPDGFNVLLSEYAQSVRDLAAVEAVPLVDVYAAFQDFSGEGGLTVDGLMSDGMHPNEAGHRLTAGLLLPEVLKVTGLP